MINGQRVVLGLVSEVNKRFINQAKLCLYSFRQNAGKLKNVPIIFITNDKPLSDIDKTFFVKHFSPIEFETKPKIRIVPPASKLNIFKTNIKYDIMLFLDCDTVVLDVLDDMLSPILNNECDFICRRGGESDREVFIDMENTLKYLEIDSDHHILFGLDTERVKFNTGVFAFKADISKRVGEDALKITSKIICKDHIKTYWMAEQCALALSCIKNNIKVSYLDEVYNSWGNLEDIKILHAFKSRYKFNRETMFEDFDQWKGKYQNIIGEKLLIREVENFIKNIEI